MIRGDNTTRKFYFLFSFTFLTIIVFSSIYFSSFWFQNQFSFAFPPQNETSKKNYFSSKNKALEDYKKIPLSFETNRGQTDPSGKFLSRGRGYSLFLTSGEIVLALRNSRQSKTIAVDSSTETAVLRLSLANSNKSAEVLGEDLLPTQSNYFIGTNTKKWRTDVANYAKVRYREVYPGIDQIYYGNRGQLEYDFIVRPKANPNEINIDFRGEKCRRWSQRLIIRC